MMENNFDLLVIGAGPGGYVAAIRAAQLGLNTAVIEKKNIGGVCLNIGCIPSKSLIHSASLFSSIRQLEAFGVSVNVEGFDYSAVFSKSRKAASDLSKGVLYLLEKNGVRLIQDEGRITAPNQIVTKLGQTLTGKYILAATGSRPKSVAGMEFDGKQILSSDDILMSDTLPKSVCIIGGGAIGCEFAYILNSFGVNVTLAEMTRHILPFEDEDAANALALAFKKKRIAVHTDAKASIVSRTSDSITVEIQPSKGNKKQIVAEKVLVVVGRTPNVAGIGFEDMSIVPKNGFIPVNSHYQTAVPSIFAIGDIIDTPMLAHVASKEGELAAEFMAGAKENEKLAYAFIPNCVYCEPQIAGFGLTEARARELDAGARAFKFPFRGTGKAVTIGQPEGFVKIITDGDGHIKGAHIIGPDATELIHELALAASFGVSVRQIAKMTHAHPTLSEAVMECARGFDNWVIHM
jgi:dihydrolipoamide dehydrogenase